MKDGIYVALKEMAAALVHQKRTHEARTWKAHKGSSYTKKGPGRRHKQGKPSSEYERNRAHWRRLGLLRLHRTVYQGEVKSRLT